MLFDQATKRGFQGYQSAHFHHHQSSHNKANPTRTEKQAITPAEERQWWKNDRPRKAEGHSSNKRLGHQRMPLPAANSKHRQTQCYYKTRCSAAHIQLLWH